MENFQKIPVVAWNICSLILCMCFYCCEQMMITHQDVVQIHESSSEGPRGWVFGRRCSRKVSITQTILGAREKRVDHVVRIVIHFSLQCLFFVGVTSVVLRGQSHALKQAQE